MHAHKARQLLGGRKEAGIRHAERGKDVLTEISIEAMSADRFDDPADPIDIDAIFPAVTRIEEQGQPQ